jgi:ribose 5-phosphate isomerase A
VHSDPIAVELGAREGGRRGGGAYRTDNGKVLLDATFGDGIEDVDVLDVTLSMVPGIAEHGLFVGLASEALLGGADGVERLSASSVA